MRNLKQARAALAEWFGGARRDLPWRRTRDPWRILVSEVMLQQTRVSVVAPFYERFLERYPDAAALATAPEQELLAQWSGLGYYTRARNLQKAARAVVERGGFPQSYEEIRELPGVGEYTAAAVASIAFGLPYAVLDGNVIRVLARAFAETGDVQTQGVRVRLKEEAQRLLDPRKPGDFNQALMELGATVCLPRNPQCLLCPWREQCAAREEGIEQELPVKGRKREGVKVHLTLCLVEREGAILLRQREAHSPRLAGFWDLPEERELPYAELGAVLGRFKHSITRHDYTVEVRGAEVVRAPRGFRWVQGEELEGLPLSTMARKGLAVGRGEGIQSVGGEGDMPWVANGESTGGGEGG
ncbi:MAG: A/G-specific adenine glycosylase [Bryobacteraceae bacterium]|nr:A/G-specific adenine glycosylase [Solibacteraceae bacterium]MCO5351011.1 A/G-specific adenine glycosylase [Bryobacteraceae bacterium]